MKGQMGKDSKFNSFIRILEWAASSVLPSEETLQPRREQKDKLFH